MALSDTTTLDGEGAKPRGRLVAIDAARGIAVVAMVVYHTAWDLSELALIRTDVSGSAAWGLFARAVAASFLTLSGVGLVLAHRQGLRPGAFLKRLGLVAAGAASITAVTFFAFPGSYIFFGVLHNIALSSVLALPFLPAPAWLAWVAAALVWALPFWLQAPWLDAPALAFLGFGSVAPITNDFVPIFPWTGFVLAGIGLAKLAPLIAPSRPASGARRSSPRIAAPLAPLGRRSLLIYLLHQPVIFGALYGYREVVGADPVAEAAPFVRLCVANCREAGQPEPLCRTTCDCTVDRLKREDRWKRIARGDAAPDDGARSSALAQACFDEAR